MATLRMCDSCGSTIPNDSYIKVSVIAMGRLATMLPYVAEGAKEYDLCLPCSGKVDKAIKHNPFERDVAQQDER